MMEKYEKEVKDEQRILEQNQLEMRHQQLENEQKLKAGTVTEKKYLSKAARARLNKIKRDSSLS